MNRYTKTLIAALGALAFTAVPAAANAERVYFLVGTRHVYRIGGFQYANVEARQKIEQDYADQVAADQDQYNKAIAGGANPDAEGQNLNAALDDLADERDKELGAIYERVDWERERHPELQIEGDGPYQVMGINFHMRGSVQIFDGFYVYAPWREYEVVERPYGWEYGVLYTPVEFHRVYVGWYGGYVSAGRPVFIGIYGHRGPIRYEIQGRNGHPFERRHIEHREAFERSSYFRGNGPLSGRTIGTKSPAFEKPKRYKTTPVVVRGVEKPKDNSVREPAVDKQKPHTFADPASNSNSHRYQTTSDRTTKAPDKVKQSEKPTTTYKHTSITTNTEKSQSLYKHTTNTSTRDEKSPSYFHKSSNNPAETNSNRNSPIRPVTTPISPPVQHAPTSIPHVTAPSVPHSSPMHVAPPTPHKKG